MRIGISLAMVGVLTLGLAGKALAQMAYACDTAENLYLVNLATGSAVLKGNTGVFLEGLAYQPGTGRLFGTTGNLYELNPNTGAPINSWPTGLGNIEGLDSDGNTLWMTDFNAQMIIHQWSTITNSFITHLDTNAQDGVSRAMALNMVGNVAYFVGDQPQFQTLWKFDFVNPATAIGPLNSQLVAAMDTDLNGTMWGLDAGGNIGTFDLATGAFTTTGNNTGGQFWLDMAILVPEPTIMPLLACGMLAVLRRRRK
jgi:hypothetical protein